MRYLRLKLTNYRGVAERELTFGQGVTLIDGPNEIGKSSMPEAIRLLFAYPDNSRDRRVRAILPVSEDVGAFVELEFRLGEIQAIYRKRFVRRPMTELQILAPTPKSYTGREAHEAAADMLRTHVDPALWEALQLEQGAGLDSLALKDSSALSRALDRAAGGEDEGDDDLMERVESEYLRYFTPTRGEWLAEHRKVFTSHDEARQQVESVLKRLQALQETQDKVQALATELATIDAGLPAAEQKKSILEKELAEARRLETAVTQLKADERAAQAEVAQLTSTQNAVTALSEEVDRLTHQRSDLLAAIETTKASESAAVTASQTADQNYEARAEHVRKAEAVARKAEGDYERCLARDSKARLDALLSRYETACDHQGAIEASLATLSPVDKGLLDKLASESVRIEAQRKALVEGSPAVSIKTEQALGIVQDGQFVEHPKGEPFNAQVLTEIELRLGDGTVVTVSPAAGAETKARELATQEAQIAALLSGAGFPTIEAMREAFEQRQAVERELAAAKHASTQILDGVNIDALKADIDRYASIMGNDQALPDTQEAHANLQRAREGVDDLRQALGKAAAEQNAQRLSAGAATADVKAKMEADKDLSERLAATQAKLTQAVQASQEQGVADKIATTQAALSEIQRDLVRQSAVLAEAKPQDLAPAASAATEALSRLMQQRAQMREARSALEGELRALQDLGLGEQLDAARAQAKARQREAEALRRQGEAVRQLRDTLKLHREAARSAYMGPLRREVEALGKKLFGEDFAVTISEDLAIVERHLAGDTLPFDDLSGGAREQLGLLMRLAAARLAVDEGGAPLVIDDALGYADAGRADAMGRLLDEVGETNQIIVLTCQPERFRSSQRAQRSTLSS